MLDVHFILKDGYRSLYIKYHANIMLDVHFIFF